MRRCGASPRRCRWRRARATTSRACAASTSSRRRSLAAGCARMRPLAVDARGDALANARELRFGGLAAETPGADTRVERFAAGGNERLHEPRLGLAGGGVGDVRERAARA